MADEWEGSPSEMSSKDLAYEMTNEQMEQAKEYASNAYDASVSYLEALKNAIQDLVLPSVDIEMPDIEIPDLDIAIPPDLGDLELELDMPIMPSLEPFNESEMAGVLATLQDTLEGTLQTGGIGITEEVENAIYARARDRKAQSFEDEQEKVEEMFSSRGFSFPPGTMASLLSRLSIEKLRSDENINNEILINQTKLAQEQIQFAMTGILELFKARIEVFGQRVAGYGSEVEAYKAKVLGGVQFIEAKVKAYEAKTRKYVAEVEMNKAYYESLTSLIGMKIDKAKIESEIALKQMEATVAGYLSIEKLQLSATEAGANVMAQLAASALSAISTATGFNYHGSYAHSNAISYNKSRQYSESDNYSEIHSYDETGV